MKFQLLDFPIAPPVDEQGFEHETERKKSQEED
jgi:hypothetical protein